MARERFLLSIWDETQGTITYTFKDEPTLGSITFETANLPDSIKICGMLHGFDQKLRDKVAGELKELGKVKFADLFKGTISDHIAQFMNDDWNAKGDGEGVPRIGLLVAAIARVKSVSVERAKAWYDAQTDAVKAGIAKVPTILAAKDAIKAERAAAKPAPIAPADALAALETL
jgi:hypothetical protein